MDDKTTLKKNSGEQGLPEQEPGKVGQTGTNAGQNNPVRNQADTNRPQPVQGGYYGYQNPYQNNWQNRKYYGNDYNKTSQNSQNGYNNYPNRNPWQGGSQQGNQYGYWTGNQPNPGNSGSGMNGTGSYGGDGPKKKNSVWKKVLIVACLGIFFGLCAGGTFFAVKTLGAKDSAETAASTAPGDGDAIRETEMPGNGETGSGGSYGTLVDVSDIVEKTMPAVVSVNAVYTYTDSYWGETYSEKYDGGGSGFIIGQNETELLIATNSHVVSDVEDMEVTFIDETKANAVTKGYDNDLDVAVIAVKLEDISEQTKDAIAVARLGDSTTLKAGQAVISIGNALLLGQSVTTGVISAVNMPVGGGYDEMGNQYGSDDRVMIQTTAFMNPGCSGGVLINASGEVVGINTMAISSEMVEGMCYAIPISDAIPVLDRLKVRDRLEEGDSGYLGINCSNVGKTQQEEYGMPIGVYISEVYEDSAAERAGLRKGDVIIALEDDTVKTIDELQEMLRYYPSGETVEVEIMRYEKGEYKSQTIEVRLGKKPE